MNALVATAIAALFTGAITYLFSQLQQRRQQAATSLVGAMRDAQTTRFLLDLADPSHAELVAEPVDTWLTFQGLTGGTATDEARRQKADEVLGWRIDEREARIRFAVTARARDVHAFASYHRLINEEAESEGRKSMELVGRTYDRTTDALVRTVISLRTPSLLRPFSALARQMPVIRPLFVRESDVRLLIADYSEARPATDLSRGFASLRR